MLFATTFFVGVSIGAPKPYVSFGTDRAPAYIVTGTNRAGAPAAAPAPAAGMALPFHGGARAPDVTHSTVIFDSNRTGARAPDITHSTVIFDSQRRSAPSAAH